MNAHKLAALRSHFITGLICAMTTFFLLIMTQRNGGLIQQVSKDRLVKMSQDPPDNVVLKDHNRNDALQRDTLLERDITQGQSVKQMKLKWQNALVMEYDEEIRDQFQKLVHKNATATDPDVITMVKNLLDPPSSHALVKLANDIRETPQSKEVNSYLKEKRNGFFIECGALDGERSSNTLPLEQKKGWTGVLIEMDPFFYTQLRGKSRKSHSINACLSPTDRPTQLPFAESSYGLGKLSKTSNKNLPMVPCLPLESILLALDRTHVDYFSLDVEGAELEVLKTIPFDTITFDILSVEYVHGAPEQAYRDFMASKGYKVLKKINTSDPKIKLYVDDLIFVKE